MNMSKYDWKGDWELNHSGDILEDLLGNNKELTLELRDAFSKDSKARFKFTVIIALLFGVLGISFLFVGFIPGIISLWLFGMTFGMFIAGLFGMLFAMPVTDSVSVHLKVIDYVDTVIRNTGWTPNNLMDGSVTGDQLLDDEDWEKKEVKETDDGDDEDDGDGKDGCPENRQW